MPTARPRHMITETDDITAALDAAARRWPESAPVLVHSPGSGRRTGATNFVPNGPSDCP
jgi:hypothetical protein